MTIIGPDRDTVNLPCRNYDLISICLRSALKNHQNQIGCDPKKHLKLLNSASGPRAGLPGPVLAGNLMHTDQNPVPNCPSLRPSNLDPDSGPFALAFPPKPVQPPEAWPGEQKHEPQLRINKIMKTDLSGTQKSSIVGVWTAPGASETIPKGCF